MTDVLALDTGGTVGVARVRTIAGAELGCEAETDALPAGHMAGYLDRALRPRDACPDVVVCERLSIRRDTHKRGGGGSDVVQAIELLGIARYLSACYGVEFVTQTPAEAKGFCSDRMLRACDLWHVGTDHPRDAMRHAVTLACERDADFRTWVAGRV